MRTIKKSSKEQGKVFINKQEQAFDASKAWGYSFEVSFVTIIISILILLLFIAIITTLYMQYLHILEVQESLNLLNAELKELEKVLLTIESDMADIDKKEIVWSKHAIEWYAHSLLMGWNILVWCFLRWG